MKTANIIEHCVLSTYIAFSPWEVALIIIPVLWMRTPWLMEIRNFPTVA